MVTDILAQRPHIAVNVSLVELLPAWHQHIELEVLDVDCVAYNRYKLLSFGPRGNYSQPLQTSATGFVSV